MVAAAAAILLVVGCSSTDDGQTDARANDAEIKDAAGDQGVDQATEDAQPEAAADASSDAADAAVDGAADAEADGAADQTIADGPADATTDLGDAAGDAVDAAADIEDAVVGDLPPIADGTFPPPPDAVADGAKTGDGPPLGCGPVSFEGCCRGEVLYFCAESGVLQSVDCTASPKCGWDSFYRLYDCGTDGAAAPTIPKPCPF
jgi:hypothetical protein